MKTCDIMLALASSKRIAARTRNLMLSLCFLSCVVFYYDENMTQGYEAAPYTPEQHAIMPEKTINKKRNDNK